jgi:Fur family zinc uptake transcriptional regulator
MSAAAPFARPRHDHEHCVATALAAAEQVCATRGLKLTPLRRRVLELVWAGHGPVGAYDLLQALAEGDGRTVQPPTVYRALEFLREAGLVHRVDALNAFIGCDRAGVPHSGQVLVCRGCQSVVEVDDPMMARALAERAAALGFLPDAGPLEIKGLCPACRPTQDQTRQPPPGLPHGGAKA